MSGGCPARVRCPGPGHSRWPAPARIHHIIISLFNGLKNTPRLAHAMQLHPYMNIADLKRLSETASVRGTEQQDTAIASAHRPWHKQRWVHSTAAGAIALVLV